jgi:hypothetical protein
MGRGAGHSQGVAIKEEGPAGAPGLPLAPQLTSMSWFQTHTHTSLQEEKLLLYQRKLSGLSPKTKQRSFLKNNPRGSWRKSAGGKRPSLHHTSSTDRSELCRDEMNSLAIRPVLLYQGKQGEMYASSLLGI